MPSRKRKKFDLTAPLGTNTGLDVPVNALKLSFPLKEAKEYSVVLRCDHSVNLSSECFTNYVRDTVSNTTNDHIIETMRLDNTVSKIENLPFSEEGTLEIRTNNTFERIQSVLSNYLPDSLSEGDEEGIKKCVFPDIAGGMLNKQKGNLLRVFYRISDDDTQLEIILIDPNHLFATEVFNDRYPDYRRNATDIGKLLARRNDLFGRF